MTALDAHLTEKRHALAEEYPKRRAELSELACTQDVTDLLNDVMHESSLLNLLGVITVKQMLDLVREILDLRIKEGASHE